MLSCWDNLRIAAAFRGLRWRGVRDHVDRLLAAFDLTGVMDQLAFTLSGGQRRRLQRCGPCCGSCASTTAPPSCGPATTSRSWSATATASCSSTTVGWPPTPARGRWSTRTASRQCCCTWRRWTTPPGPWRRPSGWGFTGGCDDEVVSLPGLDPGAQLPDLLAALRAESLPITSVDIQRSTLEDVFLALTGRRVTTAEQGAATDVEAAAEEAAKGERA